MDHRDTPGGELRKLEDAATLAGWPTTRAEDAESSGMRHGRGVADTMKAVASLAGWVSPKGRDYRCETEASSSQERMAAHPPDLNKLVMLAGWKTPTACSPNSLRGNGQEPETREAGGHAVNLQVNEARLTAFGDQPIGFLLGPNGWEIVPASGQLNAAHSRWLMGLPPIWDQAGIAASRSLKARKRGL
jgi:hypothetical protein